MKIIHKILIIFLIEVFIFPLGNSLYATEGENVFQEPGAVENFGEQPQGEEIAIEETTFSQETLPEENHITETSISEESITTLPEDTISSTPLEENFITGSMDKNESTELGEEETDPEVIKHSEIITEEQKSEGIQELNGEQKGNSSEPLFSGIIQDSGDQSNTLPENGEIENTITSSTFGKKQGDNGKNALGNISEMVLNKEISDKDSISEVISGTNVSKETAHEYWEIDISPTSGGILTDSGAIFQNLILDFIPSDPENGRTLDAYWVKFIFIAPTSITEENLDTILYTNGDRNKEGELIWKNFMDAVDGEREDGRYYMEARLPLTETLILQLSNSLNPMALPRKYQFSTTDSDFYQSFLIEVNPQNIILQKDDHLEMEVTNREIITMEGENTFTLHFQNEDEEEILKSQTGIKSGEIIPLPSAPLKEGLHFEGWFTKSQGGELISSIILTGDTTLYAHYLEDDFVYKKIKIKDLVLMDRNLGAKEPGDPGYLFQRGNNHGFLDTDQSPTTEITLPWKATYIHHGVNRAELFTGGDDYWEDHVYHNNLRGGEKDGDDNQWGMDIMVETQNDRQGACPPGWHIPSIGERNLVKKYLGETDYSSSPLLFMDTTPPFWSSSVDGNDAKGFSPSHKIEEYQRSDLGYIRCFQNYQSKKKTD